MRITISFKTLIRTPLRTFLTFLLLVVATFSIFSRAVEYSITARELDRAASFYRGIAMLDNGLPDTSQTALGSVFSEWMWEATFPNIPQQPLTREQLDTFTSLRQVTSVEMRFMTAGFSEDGYTRLDFKHDPSYNYTNRFILEGTYSKVSEGNIRAEDSFHMLNCVLLAGGSDLLRVGNNVMVQVSPYDGGGGVVPSGERSGEASRFIWQIRDNPYGLQFRATINDGERCLIIGRWEPRRFAQNIYLGDMDTLGYMPSFYRLDGLPDDYLELDEFAHVRELIEITNNDLRTFDMVYTSDMPSIPRFANNEMVITDGRMLTSEDEGTANCVVSTQFMRIGKRLHVGDTITMSLGSKLLEQNAMTGAVACIPERYAPPGETVELTIVGVYRDVDTLEDRLANAYTGYTANTIFVPFSLLPAEVPNDHQYMPGEYSLIVGSALDNDAFLETAIPLAEEMGLTLRFNDSGWASVEQNFGISRQMSLLTAVLFFAAAAASILMSLWLFIWRGRANYAIMRALGAPRSKSQNALLLPFFALCILAIPIGTAAGLIFTSQSVMPVLERIAEVEGRYVIDAALPMQTILICISSEMVFLAITAALFMFKLGRMPVLALLQGNNVRVVKERTQPKLITRELSTQSNPNDEYNGATSVTKSIQHGSPNLSAHGRKYGAFRFVYHSALRRSRRAFFRAMLALVLTVIMCGAMGMLTVTRQNYYDLYNNTEVKGFLQYAASDALEDAVKSELLKDVYYREELNGAVGYFGLLFPRNMTPASGFLVNLTAKATTLVVTSDIERFMSDMRITDYEASYIDGFNGQLIETDIQSKVVLGSSIASNQEISLGDTILLGNQHAWDIAMQIFETDFPDGPPEHPRQLRVYNTNYKSHVDSRNRQLTVAGIIDCEQYNTSIFLPVGERTEWVLGAKYSVGYSEFVVADFDRMEETEELLASYRARSTRLSAHATLTLDASERENIESILELLNTLFPYAVVAAVSIGVIAPFLMLLLSAKEAAVMRVLGTTKRRARSMLVLEQAGLCMFGIALAAIGLYIYDAALMLRAGETLLFCGGLYVLGYILASVAASFIVTHRKPLELLQVKE